MMVRSIKRITVAAVASSSASSTNAIASSSTSISIGIQTFKRSLSSESIETTPLESELSPISVMAPVKEKKARKPRTPKVKEPITYIIPDVETKKTTWNGRLGYACLNTVLRDQKPSVFCSRTCRIATIEKEGLGYVKELGRLNVVDLNTMIEWNVAHGIYFLRLSSEIFPFAAHEKYGYSLDYAAEELKVAGDTAKRLNVRLTTHPGQFTQLGSNRPIVAERAIKDLAYHCEMFERMGMSKDSVMIIHGGGMYDGKTEALQRFSTVYKGLPSNIKERLVLENDEICFNCDDLLPICEELNIPLVLDYHHDSLFPSTLPVAQLMPRILATWSRKGIKPKQHLSEARRGAVTLMEKRAHSDRCQQLPIELNGTDIDLMIEAKDKEQAVFHLFRIYQLHPVIFADLRPPALEETTQTNGRKSNKKKPKIEVKDEVEEDGIAPLPETPLKKRSNAKRGGTSAMKPSEAKYVDEEEDELSPLENYSPSVRAVGTKRKKRVIKEEEEDYDAEDASML